MARDAGRRTSGRIAHHSIEQVLERSDLGDLAAGYTQMRPQGGELQGRCPFHDERSPSFWVNPTKGVYYCFGCGAAGDTITFVQEKLGLDKPIWQQYVYFHGAHQRSCRQGDRIWSAQASG